MEIPGAEETEGQGMTRAGIQGFTTTPIEFKQMMEEAIAPPSRKWKLEEGGVETDKKDGTRITDTTWADNLIRFPKFYEEANLMCGELTKEVQTWGFTWKVKRME